MIIDVTLPHPRFDVPFVLAMTNAYMYKHVYEQGYDLPVQQAGRSTSTSSSPKYYDFINHGGELGTMLDFHQYDPKHDLGCFATWHGMFLAWPVMFKRVLTAFIALVGEDVTFNVSGFGHSVESLGPLVDEMNTKFGKPIFTWVK